MLSESDANMRGRKSTKAHDSSKKLKSENSDEKSNLSVSVAQELGISRPPPHVMLSELGNLRGDGIPRKPTESGGN